MFWNAWLTTAKRAAKAFWNSELQKSLWKKPKTDLYSAARCIKEFDLTRSVKHTWCRRLRLVTEVKSWLICRLNRFLSVILDALEPSEDDKLRDWQFVTDIVWSTIKFQERHTSLTDVVTKLKDRYEKISDEISLGRESQLGKLWAQVLFKFPLIIWTSVSVSKRHSSPGAPWNEIFCKKVSKNLKSLTRDLVVC